MATLKYYNQSTSQWEYINRSVASVIPNEALSSMSIHDSLQEWWIYPVSTYVGGENRTIFGGYSTNGHILVNEMNHQTGELKRREVATTWKIDDHNNPAVFAEEGRRIVIAYQNHGGDALLRFKVSDETGSIDSLVTASEQNYDAGAAVTYAQIHKIDHLSDSTKDVLWVFFRHTTLEYAIVQVTVPQDTGVLTFDWKKVVFSAVAQSYIITTPSYLGDNIIRVGWYHNPTQEPDAINYVEINTATGDMISPTTSASPLANLNTPATLPLTWEECTPVVTEPANPDTKRRLFYVRSGPMTPAIAYAEWDINDPDNAVYHVARATDSTATTWEDSSYGIAGPRVGYVSSSNYIAGMAFPEPAYQDSVIVARNGTFGGTVELYSRTDTAETKKVIYETQKWVGRPMATKFAGPIYSMFSDVSMYNSFADYDSKVVLNTHRPEFVTDVGGSISGTPSISVEGGWTVINHGTYKEYLRRLTGMTTSGITPGGHVQPSGGEFNLPTGISLNDCALATVDMVNSADGGHRWAARFNGGINPATPGAVASIHVRNLTTATVSMIDGRADVRLIVLTP